MRNKLAVRLVEYMLPYIQSALEPMLDRLIDQAEPVIARKVRAIIEKEMDDIDVSDKIADAIRDADITREVEQSLVEHDIPRLVSDAIEEENIEAQVETEIEDAINEWEFDRTTREKLNDVVRQELKKIFTEQLVN